MGAASVWVREFNIVVMAGLDPAIHVFMALDWG